MSRSGYSDDLEPRVLNGWRGVVASSLRGKRGQALLRDLVAKLEAMPEKKLAAYVLERDGEVCALGELGRARGLDLQSVDPEDYDAVAKLFDVPAPLVRELVNENDEGGWVNEKPEHRWGRMHHWATRHILPPSKPKVPRPTPAQRRVLENMVAGRVPGDHLRGRAEHGGFVGTMLSLRRRGWVDDNGLTAAGRLSVELGNPSGSES